MNDRLPPLTALRAFDAAARHMSFAMAANELNVTPAALSFQIKALEDHLGQPVFKRLNRAVELTEVGKLLAPAMKDGFETLGSAWQTARRFLDQTHLTVTAGPAFTAKWLAPRLFDFAQAHPTVELRFSAALRMMDFDRDDVDVAIRFGLGPDENVFSQRIMGELFVPLCTPALAQGLADPAQLLDMTLLRTSDTDFLNPACNWQAWFQAVGITASTDHVTTFNQSDHAIDAAIGGAGVLLGRTSLAHKALRDGHLVAPFDQAIETAAHYRLLCPQGAQERPHIKAFMEWTLKECATVESATARYEIVPVKS